MKFSLFQAKFIGIPIVLIKHLYLGENMTLVPIIYTSLILVMGLFLIVVTISYLTYKVKATSNPVIEDELRKNQVNIVRKKVLTNHAIRYDAGSHLQPSYNTNSFQNAAQYVSTNFFDNEPKVSAFEVESILPKKIYTNYDQEQKIDYNQKKNRISNTRIEIMNDSKSFRVQKEENQNNQQKPVRYTSTRDKSEYNFLNFYSDIIERNPTKDDSLQRKVI